MKTLTKFLLSLFAAGLLVSCTCETCEKLENENAALKEQIETLKQDMAEKDAQTSILTHKTGIIKNFLSSSALTYQDGGDNFSVPVSEIEVTLYDQNGVPINEETVWMPPFMKQNVIGKVVSYHSLNVPSGSNGKNWEMAFNISHCSFHPDNSGQFDLKTCRCVGGATGSPGPCID